jgi:hypothetical protein
VKRLLGFLVVGAWLLGAGVPVSAQQLRPKVTSLAYQPHSVLFVGNSFFYYNNGIDSMVGGLYGAAGLNGRLGGAMVTIGGAGWKWHDVESYFRPDAINSFYFDDDYNAHVRKDTGKLFDTAVMMDCSKCSIDPLLKDEFPAYARKHSDTVRSHGAEPVFFMTWAYKYAPEMTMPVANAYTQIGNDNNALVIPAGLAFARARRDRPGIELYNPDKRHPSLAGTYLAACTVFSSLFGRSPAGLKYYGGLPHEVARRLQEEAWATVQEYYGR